MLVDHKVLSVLMQLHDGSARTGAELVANSRGVLSRTTINVLLSRMKDDGMIEVKREDLVATENVPGVTGMARETHVITALGRQRMAVVPEARVLAS